MTMLLSGKRRGWRLSFALRGGCICHMLSPMGMRREARERAVQFLFQYDVNPPENLERAIETFWLTHREFAVQEDKATWGQQIELPPPTSQEMAVRLFAEPLMRGVIQNREELDGHIRQHARNWDLNRMAVVDRNVMRLAIYEMLHREDIPPVVSINEAVDIAKRFSTDESGRFVNGILDKVRSGILRPARDIKS